MHLRGLIHRLRYAVAATGLTMCGLVVVLWSRTFARADVVWSPLPGDRTLLIVSAPGFLELSLVSPTPQSSTPWGLVSHNAEPNRIRRILNLNFASFGIRQGWNGKGISLTSPHWFVLLMAATIATLALIKWQRRFTLRTMFATITVVAIALWMFESIKG